MNLESIFSSAEFNAKQFTNCDFVMIYAHISCQLIVGVKIKFT